MAKKEQISRRDWLVVIMALMTVAFVSSGLLWVLNPIFMWVFIGFGIGIIVLGRMVTKEPEPETKPEP